MKRSVVVLIAAYLLVSVFQTGCSEPSATDKDSQPQGNAKVAPAPTATVASTQQPVAEKPAAEKSVTDQPAVKIPVETQADKPKIPDAPKAITWATDWDSAKKSAGDHKQLVMADFYTDWCGWCKKLDRDTFSNSDVIQLSTRFVPLKVNASREGSSMAQQYGVRSYPTILFLDSNGKLFTRIVGYLPPAEFADRLQEIQKSFNKS